MEGAYLGKMNARSQNANSVKEFIEKMGQQGLIGMGVFPNTTQTKENKSDPEPREEQGRLERSPTGLGFCEI